MHRLAVLILEASHSRLICVPKSLSDLITLVSQLLVLKRVQVTLVQLKDDVETPMNSDTALEAALEDHSDTLVLAARVRPESEIRPTTNYVLAFTGRHKLRVHNLDDESVTYWESKNVNWTGRVCVKAENVLIFTGGNSKPNSAHVYDLTLGRETKLEDMKRGRMWHGLCALEGAVYAVGGREASGGQSQASTEVLIAESWKELPALNTPRESMTLLPHQQAVFAFGGFDGSQRLTTIEKYEGQVWTVLSIALPAPRQMPGVLLTAMKALIVGGQDDRCEQNAVLELDLETGEIQQKPALPAADFFTGRQVVRRREQVWAFGRKTYVLSEDRWSSF